MKILHLIQRPQLRGAEVFASQIGEQHHREGHEVKFLALFAHPGAAQLQPEGPELEVLALEEDRRLFDWAGWKCLAQAIKAFRPDIVQANAADTLKYAVFSRLLFGWPGQLVYRNANKTSDFIRNPLQRVYNQWLSHRVDFVASVSRNCEMDFQKLFHFPASKTATLTIGTPIPEPGTLPDKPAIRHSLGLPEREPLIINIGSFVPEKNHRGLIDIFAALRETTGKGQLILIGDGKLRKSIEARIAEHQLEEHIHLLGFRSDATTLLAACDLMLMPSFIEGMPGVILEAMARRVPVIASDVGGINEVIHHGERGYLGDPRRPATFIEPALNMLRDKQLADRVQERAYEFVVATKSIEVIANQFMDCYQKLLQE